MKHPALVSVVTMLAIAIVFFGGCTYVVSGYERAFERTSDGDSMANVLARFGEPSVREQRDHPFLRYGPPCEACAARLWWEHPILRGFEAWSVEFDNSGRVAHKAHWVSP
jgi:hypothetical protein